MSVAVSNNFTEVSDGVSSSFVVISHGHISHVDLGKNLGCCETPVHRLLSLNAWLPGVALNVYLVVALTVYRNKPKFTW